MGTPTGPRPGGSFAACFGANVTRARERAGLSQEDLAFDADLHRTAVGQLERGVVAPQLKTAVKIAAALGIPIEQLLAGIEWSPPVRSGGGFACQRHELEGDIAEGSEPTNAASHGEAE